VEKDTDGTYEKVTIEAAKDGWILRRLNRPAEVFVRWPALINRIEHLLTTKGMTET